MEKAELIQNELGTEERAPLLEKDVLVKEEVIQMDDVSLEDVIRLNLMALKLNKSVEIQVSKQCCIKELKQRALEELGEGGEKYVRLICQGKLLSDENATVGDYKLNDGGYVHCAVSDRPQTLHVKTAAISTSGDLDEQAPSGPARGFDRLGDRLSREEIQALRLYFYPQISNLIAQSQPLEGEMTEDRIYRIEEEWMAAQGPHSEFALNVTQSGSSSEHWIQIPVSDVQLGLINTDNEGTPTDMVWGFILGLLLGFILLFWLWERSIPRRQKLGIVVGVTLNVMISLTPRHVDP